jgi:hypothetical protein
MTQSREIPMKQSSVDVRGTQPPRPGESAAWKSRLLSLWRPWSTTLPLSHHTLSVHVRKQSWEGAGARKIAYKFSLNPVSDYLLPIFLEYARQRNIHFFSILLFFLLLPLRSIGHPWNALFHFSFLILRQSVGLLGRRINLSQGRYLHRTTQTRNRRTNKHPGPELGFEPPISAFKQAKTVHAWDRAAIWLAIYI